MAAVLNDFVDFYQSNKNIEGSNLEFEIRFHKNENSRKLLKSDMDNVIKKVLEEKFECISSELEHPR